MKYFWGLMALLLVGAGAYLVLGRGGDQGTPRVAALPSGAPEARPETPAVPGRLPGERDKTEAAFFAGDAKAGAADATAAAPSTPSPAPSSATPDEATPASVEKTPEPAAVAPGVSEKPAAPSVPDAKPEVKEAPSAPPPAAPAAAPAAPVTAPTSTPPPADSVAFSGEARVVRQDDGSLMVDEKYPVKGEGTKESPYQITWEYLVSAQEEYQPRLGKKKLPGRMRLISGKYVKITGNVAFPVMATEATEMLMMLNQWDGCCIGIPPSPYDAIEVKLAGPATTEQRLTTFGTIEGKMLVEPYLVRDWLVSLYVMDEATLRKAE